MTTLQVQQFKGLCARWIKQPVPSLDSFKNRTSLLYGPVIAAAQQVEQSALCMRRNAHKMTCFVLDRGLP